MDLLLRIDACGNMLCMMKWKMLMFLFSSHDTFNSSCITVFSVSVDGWLALVKQVGNVAAEGFTVG